MKEDRRGEVALQERDFRILLDLYLCRAMTLRHVCEVHFEGRPEAAKKRLQRLKLAGLVRERARRIGEPSVLHLTRVAFVALQHAGKLENFPSMPLAVMEKRSRVSDLTLRHELEVMDVRTAFLTAARRATGLSFPEFSTWPALHQFEAQHVSPASGRRVLAIKPDGFIRSREEQGGEAFERLFFLEVDRSTEVQETVCQKAACYVDFYQKGGMAQRFGAPRDDYRKFPFRLLLVFRTEERRNNVAEGLLRNAPPILSLAWLCTMAQVLTDPLGAIWMRPIDYRHAISGSRFDALRRNAGGVYRRQTERENLVKTKAKLRSLFEEERPEEK